MWSKSTTYEGFEDDLPMAATFISTADAKHLKLVIKPVDSLKETDGAGETRYTRNHKTGVRVTFKAGHFSTSSSKMVEALMKTPAYQRSVKGFNIDPADLTGFWRAAGMITTKQVTTTVAVAQKGQVPFDIKAAKAAAKKMAEAGEAVEPLAVGMA